MERGRTGQGQLPRPEPHQEALLSNEPSNAQSEAMTDRGQPAPTDAEVPRADTHADTVPRACGPSPSSSQSSRRNDTGQWMTLFAWATYQTKRFKLNKDTLEIKNNFLITLEKTFKSHPTIFYEPFHA